LTGASAIAFRRRRWTTRAATCAAEARPHPAYRPAEYDGRLDRVFDLDQCAGMRRLIARLADHHGDRLACTVNLVESLPRSIQADIKVFSGSQANALMEARRLSCARFSKGAHSGRLQSHPARKNF
jgi:hypothetical protein